MTDKSNNTNAIDIIKKHIIGDDEEAKRVLEEERINADLARKIYAIMKAAGYSEKQLEDL